MCSHYEAPSAERIRSAFGNAPDGDHQMDLWPTYLGPFVKLPDGEDDDTVGEAQYDVLVGQFGLLPFWAKDQKLGRRTYNARSETASSKASFRSAWAKAQHCVIPAAAIYEPDWRSGKAVATRIGRVDGGIMSIAGLWERWKSPAGEVLHSYTMLTVNADDHSFMRDYHKPDDEKRMVVVLPNGLIDDWLRATAEQSRDFLRQYPADRMRVLPSEKEVS